MTKNIAVFSDGTGQTIGPEEESNVLHLLRLVDRSDARGQVLIYDPGIGTHVSRRKLEASLGVSERVILADSNPRCRLLARLRSPREMAFGSGALANIQELYRALIEVYEPGDAIYLFGFSRGAFTVRALAGLIYRCGMLRRDAKDRIDVALGWCGEHYTALGDRREAYRAKVDAFRRECSQPCNVRFLGVWDTVKSVGYLDPLNFPHVRHNPIVQDVRHALALDERRSFYQMTTWGGRTEDTRGAVYAKASFELDRTDDPPGEPQSVQEVWFPGNHRDVGGGYRESAAANNALRWMIAEAAHCGLAFVDAAFSQDKDEPVTRRHDEMHESLVGRLLWWAADRVPRRDLRNEPPPPVVVRTHSPAGPREIADSKRNVDRDPDFRRNGRVSIHASARSAYPAGTAPWRELPADELRWVATRAD